MPIPNYSRVRLITSRLCNEGAAYGTIGYVIEAYKDGCYEVEFSDSEGTTLATVVAREDELEIEEVLQSSDNKSGDN